MAWRVPRFGVLHLFRDRGYDYMSIHPSRTIASGDYLSFCFDERRETMTFTAAASLHWVGCDTGVTPISVSHIVIPAGHGCNGKRIKVKEDDDSDFSSPVDRLWIDPTDDGLIDEAITPTVTTERYVQVAFEPTAGTVNPTIPELWLTNILAPGQSAEPTWRDERFYNVQTFITPAGDRGDLQLGASQRIFELEFPRIDAAADIAMLDQLVDDIGMEQAFLFWPPFDDEEVLICKMLRPPERRFAHPAPAGGSKAYTYRFSIIEQLV